MSETFLVVQIRNALSHQAEEIIDTILDNIYLNIEEIYIKAMESGQFRKMSHLSRISYLKALKDVCLDLTGREFNIQEADKKVRTRMQNP